MARKTGESPLLQGTVLAFGALAGVVLALRTVRLLAVALTLGGRKCGMYKKPKKKEVLV